MRTWNVEEKNEEKDILAPVQEEDTVSNPDSEKELEEGFWGDAAKSVAKAAGNAVSTAASAAGNAVTNAAKSVAYKVSSPKKYIEDILSKELDRNGVRVNAVSEQQLDNLKLLLLQYAPDCAKEGKLAIFHFLNGASEIMVVIGKHVWAFPLRFKDLKEFMPKTFSELARLGDRFEEFFNKKLSSNYLCKNVSELEAKVFSLLNIRTPATEAYDRGFKAGQEAAFSSSKK